MTNRYEKRIQKELAALKSEESPFEVKMTEDINLFYFIVKVPAGVFIDQEHVIEVKLKYGNGEYSFPTNAPLCTFMTPIWHPNVGKGGTICLDVLKHNWTPITRLSSVVDYLLLLLQDPNSTDPMNPICAKDFIQHQPERIVKITRKYYEDEGGPTKVNYYRFINY